MHSGRQRQTCMIVAPPLPPAPSHPHPPCLSKRNLESYVSKCIRFPKRLGSITEQILSCDSAAKPVTQWKPNMMSQFPCMKHTRRQAHKANSGEVWPLRPSNSRRQTRKPTTFGSFKPCHTIFFSGTSRTPYCVRPRTTLHRIYNLSTISTMSSGVSNRF